jgi:hypothetical protein
MRFFSKKNFRKNLNPQRKEEKQKRKSEEKRKRKSIQLEKKRKSKQFIVHEDADGNPIDTATHLKGLGANDIPDDFAAMLAGLDNIGAEPGSVEPGSVEPGSVEPGSVEPGSVEPGSMEGSGSAEPGSGSAEGSGSAKPGSRDSV